jgi:hypothetical protein
VDLWTAALHERFRPEHHVAAVQQPVVFPVFKGGGEVKYVEGPRQVFNRVVEISRRFRIIQNYQVIEFFQRGMSEKPRKDKLRCAPV